MEIGEMIKQRREQLNMSQEELAKKIGYKSRSSINKIEVDGRGLPQSKIVAIATALQTTPSYLMGWDDGNRYFHLNLDFLLRHKEIDLSKLASETNIGIERTRRFLEDKEDPTMSELRELANFFGVKKSDLLSKKMDSFSEYREIYGNDGSEMFDLVEKHFGIGITRIVELAIDLNFEGVDRVIQYIEDLKSSEKYRKE